MRLPLRPGERIDRSTTLTFAFEGKPVTAFAGDTIGSALYAAGRRVFSRSFKYHRPRGLLCCSGQCPNCLMQVDGVPNVRVCTERGFRELLVGFETENGTVPPEGGQIVRDGRPAGRVTSARWSGELGRAIGMAWVPPDLAEEGAAIEIRVDGRLERASVRLRPFFDPEGERLRS